jgi:hypothetical protein
MCDVFLTDMTVAQVTTASPESTVSGSMSDEEALDDESSPSDLPKSKNRFKKFLKALKITTKSKDSPPVAKAAAKTQSNTSFLPQEISLKSPTTKLRR